MLAQTFDEELLFPVHQGVVDGSPAQIDSRHYFHGLLQSKVPGPRFNDPNGIA